MEDKTLLTEEEIKEALSKYNGWSVEGKCFVKRFYFENWNDITQFIKHLGKTIEKTNHHPDINLHTGSRSLTIYTTTHAVGGLSKADLYLIDILEQFQQS
jgi:pterin-4a-carbinolamine dehydratase